MEKSTKEYLDKIRLTIAESKRMVESVKLRFAETDRMLEESGTSREEVMKMRFSPDQKAAVNAELQRRGFAPIEDPEEEPSDAYAAQPMYDAADVSQAHLPCDFSGCNKVHCKHRLFQIFIPDKTARIYVHDGHRLRVFNDEISAVFQGNGGARRVVNKRGDSVRFHHGAVTHVFDELLFRDIAAQADEL